MKLDVFLEHALSPLTLPIFAIVVILSTSGSTPFLNKLVMIFIPAAIYGIGHLIASKFSRNENVYSSLPCAPALAAFAAVYSVYGPEPIVLLSAVSVCVFFMIVYVLRTRWRISMHMIFYVGISTILSIMDTVFLLMFALVPAVAWCRLSLKRHTPAQLVAGFVTGLAVPVSTGFFIGLI